MNYTANLERIPFIMEGIPADPEAQARRGWALKVNGEEITDPINTVELTNQKMGLTVQYGQRPEGYDGPAIHEPGGGGAVTIPYMIDHKTGGMYIGVVQEDRKLAGGMVYNVPRGFLDSGETHSEAAVREVHEETGLAVMASRLIHLGNGINPNMAFFDTSRTTVDGQPEGVSIFGLPVYYNEVETIVGPEGQIHYRFREEIRAEAQPESPEERILGSIFIPMAEAVQSPDVYTSAAAGRLIAHMLGNGIMRLSHIEHPKS